ncbi:hypothetical protein X732_30630 [Mesorhizobium sp. L2C066B000]|nr:hypothetical protein X732_30630 [Mesorhizobium sp. L2C066B000]
MVSSEEKEELVPCSDGKAIVIAAHDGSKMDASQAQVRRAWGGGDRGAYVVIDMVRSALFRGLDRAGSALRASSSWSASPRATSQPPGQPSALREPDRNGCAAQHLFRWALKRMRSGANVAAVLPFDGLIHGLQDIPNCKVTGKLVVKTETAI